MKKVAIIISPNYKDYAEKYLADCIESVKGQDYAGEMKIFITDNESSEVSYEYLKKVLNPLNPPLEGGYSKIPLTPFAKGGTYEIVRNKNNDGFAKGCNDCMKLALAQGFDYVVLFNMDTILAPDCVSKMVEAAEDKIPLTPFFKGGEKEIGAVQARLMLFEDRNKINSLGNVTHFLGFGYSKGYGEEIKSPLPPFLKGVEIAYPSGATVLYRAEVLKKIGLFDEQMWMYNEDQDLGWRVWLSGRRCILAPEAVAYHKYEFSRSMKKYYFMDRNRIIAMLKNYHWATLILIFPAFIVMEIGLIFFSIWGGWFKEKIKVYGYFLSGRHWQRILAKRKKIQASRRVNDKDIIKLFSGKIWYQEVDSVALGMGNILFNAYWLIVKSLIRW